MKMKKYSSLINYMILAFLILALSAIISVCIRSLLLLEAFPWPFSEEQVSLIASLIGVVMTSVATSLVFYQLKIGNESEKQQGNINQARFVLEFNQAFIQDANMIRVEELLEDVMVGRKTGPIIRDDNRQMFINYLVYLESLAPLLLNDVLTFSSADDLFAYRFFLAVNNPEMQEDQLFAFPDYYRGCFKLYEEWKAYRVRNGLPILQSETALDKWPHYKAYCNRDITVRPMNDTDNKRNVAALIYQTDPYIYPALFGTLANAKRKLPAMMSEPCVFHSSHIRVAEWQGEIVGAAVVLEQKPAKGLNRSLVHGASGRHVCEHYFDNIGQYFEENNETYILCLCVDPKMRGKKIGELLLKHSIKTSNRKVQKLHVLDDNEPAIELYKKHGFVIPEKGHTAGYAYNQPAPGCYEMVRREM